MELTTVPASSRVDQPRLTPGRETKVGVGVLPTSSLIHPAGCPNVQRWSRGTTNRLSPGG